MEDKNVKKLKRYLEDVIEGRDDLLQITEKLIATATFQVQAVLNSQVEALPKCKQKEALLKYLTKAVILFSELNSSVYNFIETERLPISENVQTCEEPQKEEPDQVQSPPIKDLNDFFKEDVSHSTFKFDFSTSGPKVSNSQVVNDSYIRKPLDNTTLKAICLANSHESACNSRDICEESAPKPSVSAVEDNTNMSLSNNAVEPVERSNRAKSLIQEHHEANTITSPTFSLTSDSEVFSTVSSIAYQHPLAKFQPPAKIPNRYDTQDLEKIKENLNYLSKKMGFDTAQLNQMQSQFSKVPIYNCDYEEPVKDVLEEREIRTEEVVVIAEENNTVPSDTSIINEEVPTSKSVVTEHSKSEAPQKLDDENDLKFSDDNAVVLNNQIYEGGPSTSCAIRKNNIITDDLIVFSGSSSDSESCGKVSTWLKNMTVLNTTSEEVKFKPNSAIDKLHGVKRYDRNEEAREQARKNMPDIKFVPVEVPSVIKNNLSSTSSKEKKNDSKKKKLKDVNLECETYEIKKMEPPGVDAVCVFSHIDSPSEFYLQILNDVSTACIDEISDKLDAKFRDTRSPFQSKQDAYDGLGKYCFGYVLEERPGWYRLQVTDWELGCQSPDVEVKAVDYGFRCRTSYTYLRQMTRDLAEIPMLAIQCHFPFLYPPGSTFSNILPEWPQMTIDNLYDITNLDDSYVDYSDFKMFQITLAMLEGDSLAVDLVPYNEAGADSLRNLLLDFQLATEIYEDFGDHPEIGEFLEDIDELERPENLNELVLAYDAKDEMRICRFTRKDGTCYKGKNCKLEHITLKDGYTTDKATVFYTAINDPIFPVNGESLCVLVTSYIDSCTYLVQIVRKPIVKDNTNIMMDRDISDLMDAMNHPKKISKYESFKVYPAMGEVILAYHSLSRMWMRAAVRDLRYDMSWNLMDLEVYAVDFGDEFTVKLKDTRVMLEDFMHVPFQVVQIYLDKYEHSIGCNARKAKSFWDKHISYKNFMVHIKSSAAPFKVNLTTFKGREIGHTLIKEGFARKRSMDILIAEGNEMELY